MSSTCARCSGPRAIALLSTFPQGADSHEFRPFSFSVKEVRTLSDEKPRSYLAEVKGELNGIFDEAFSFVWSEVEKNLKQSYRNGFADGQKSTGKSITKSTRSGRNWKRGESSEDSE